MKTTGGRIMVILGLLGAVYACENAPQPLSLTERNVADSIYRAEVVVVRTRMDSICLAHTDSLTWSAVDSLFEFRLQEIKKQLNRIKNVQ